MTHPIKALLSSYSRIFTYSAGDVLLRRGVLDRLYTADLKRPPAALRPATSKFPAVGAIAGQVLGRVGVMGGMVQRIWTEYDAWVARRVEGRASRGANVFHGWSLYCLESMKVAERAGMVTVVDRSCPHISTQRAILEEELALLGIRESLGESPYFAQAPRMIEEYHAADYIVTCSEYSRGSFIANGFSPDRVVNIPLGANFVPQRVDRSEAEPFRVLCVGTHPYRKGVVHLIRAWQRARLPNARLVLRTPVSPQVAALIDDESITVLPRLSREQLAEEYRRATVFCLPSIDEGFGMVVLEAMSFGLPVVASSHVGAAELMRSGVDGLTFPVRDVEALAEHLTTLYRDRALARWMGENALQTSQQYDWNRYTDELVRFYGTARELQA
jgi:glycosyltransferase involved in cell wall biosynthesis